MHAKLLETCDSTSVLQVLVPTSQFIRSLVAARLAADVLDVPTVLIARTDAHSAALLTSDVDEVDRAFCTGERTPEGFFRVQEGVKVASKLTRCIKLHTAGCSFVAVCHAPPISCGSNESIRNLPSALPRRCLLPQASIARGLAYAPYADMLWMETSTPSLEEAKEFADAIHAKYPGKQI